MDRTSFEYHLNSPIGLDYEPADAISRVAGGAACGDLIRISLVVHGSQVTDAGFAASGCPTMIAAGSAAVSLVKGVDILDAAKISAQAIATELGGLSPGKFHAADLTADALAQALGVAARTHAQLEHSAERTLVAMSGGVDSAVAALLCSRAGRDCVATTLELWADPDNDATKSCCSAHAVRSARAVAHSMGMAHFTIDLRKEFRDGVVQPFLEDHALGLTPNPCIRCNGNVRLDAMLEFADRLGASDLATGHYARHADNGLLRLANDPAKDQSYMLAALKPQSVARLRFPLGELTKPEVRKLAAEAGLPVARKPESQDLCFLAGTGRAAFLKKHGDISERSGAIINRSGQVLGEHSGHHNFTVGQRKGLALAATEPLYVLATNASKNTVTVGLRDELKTKTVAVRDAELYLPAAMINAVKLRYRSRPIACHINSVPSKQLAIELAEPVFGAAPGQAAVFFADDVIAGCATISEQSQ